MPQKPNPKQAWVADIEFVLSECVRFNEFMARTPPREMVRRISSADASAGLPSPTGQGHIMCGVDALLRVRALVARALSNSDASGAVEPDKVYTVLKRVIVDRFIKEVRSVDIPQVERASRRGQGSQAAALRCRPLHPVPSDARQGAWAIDWNKWRNKPFGF